MVFISYKSGEDTIIAVRIVQDLEKMGIPCFYYERDCVTPENANRDWQEVIPEVLNDKTTVFLLIATSNSAASNQVHKEVRFLESKKRDIYTNRFLVLWVDASMDKRNKGDWMDLELPVGRQMVKTTRGLETALTELYGRICAIEGYAEQKFISAHGDSLHKFSGGTESLVIPSVFSEIAAGAFYGNSEIKYIKVPKSVSCIGQAAFANCKNLTEIEFETPENIERVELFAFEGTPCAVQAREMTVVSHCILTDCRAGGNVVLPDGITCIADAAFEYNDKILSVAGKNVRYIGNGAFASCPNLTKKDFPKQK